VFGVSRIRLVPGRYNDLSDLNRKLLDLPDWRIVGVGLEEGIGEYPYLVDEETLFSRVTLTVDVERRRGYYIWKFLVPLVLIVLLSWVVFWIGSGELESQMQVSIKCVLSVIAFNFVISEQLPRTGYLTVLDYWVLLSYIFVAAGTFENVVAHRLVRAGREGAADRVDHWSRVLFPATYVLLNALVFVHSLLLS